jgi:hypothetical protein
MIEENSVIFKSPRLFGGKQTSFPLGQMVVSIKNTDNGFCEIEFSVNSKSFRIQGFTIPEAKMIKSMIQDKNINATNSGIDDYQPLVNKGVRDNGEDMMQYGNLLHRMENHRKKCLSVVRVKNPPVMINNGLKKEAADLIRYYNGLDIELLDDDAEIDKNKKITGIFVSDCLTKAGRGRIRDVIKQVKDDEEDNEYTNGVECILTMIDIIYSSLVYKALDSENKPMFPFGLDKKKVVDKITDLSVSNSHKMSRITRSVDNFITRIGTALKNAT